jgi:hypothetical protein
VKKDQEIFPFCVGPSHRGDVGQHNSLSVRLLHVFPSFYAGKQRRDVGQPALFAAYKHLSASSYHPDHHPLLLFP